MRPQATAYPEAICRRFEHCECLILVLFEQEGLFPVAQKEINIT
jgi:hypothetical protein